MRIDRVCIFMVREVSEKPRRLVEIKISSGITCRSSRILAVGLNALGVIPPMATVLERCQDACAVRSLRVTEQASPAVFARSAIGVRWVVASVLSKVTRHRSQNHVY